MNQWLDCAPCPRGKSSFNTIGHVPREVWILDTRIAYHMTLFPMLFNSYVKINKEQHIRVANSDSILIQIWEYNVKIIYWSKACFTCPVTDQLSYLCTKTYKRLQLFNIVFLLLLYLLGRYCKEDDFSF